ncbi:MAG: histidine kinase [Bacteroidota bacterium]
MKRWLFLWVFISGWATTRWAQQSTIDSLQTLLHLGNPTEEDLAHALAISDLHEAASDYAALIQSSNQLEQLATKLGDFNYLGHACYDQASAHWNLGDYQQAILKAQRALVLYQKAENEKKQIHTLYLQGMIHGDRSQYTLAKEKYFEAIHLAEATKDSLAEGAILNSVGLVHKWLKNYPQAETAFQRSIRLLSNEAYTFRKAMSISNLGALYTEIGRHQEALAQFEQSRALFRMLDSEWGLKADLGNLGYCLTQLNRAKEALPLLEENLEYARSIQSPKGIAAALMLKGAALEQLGQDQQAQTIWEEALLISDSTESLDYKRQSLEGLSRLKAKDRNFLLAYTLLAEAKVIGDTLFTRQNTADLAELTERYESDKQAADIKLLTAQNKLMDQRLKNQARIRFALTIGSLLIALIAYLIWNIQRNILDRQQLEQDRQEALFRENAAQLESKALRAQMNPHFLFNAMNSVNRLILDQNHTAASQHLTKFSKLMRKILEHSELPMISLAEELELIEAYIQLEALRFKNRFSYHIAIDESIDTSTIDLPSMLLQPFIENAIWHGLQPKSGEGRIEIQFQLTEEQLVCTIEDNGIGRVQAKALQSAPEKQSMAIQINRDRLKLLQDTDLDPIVFEDLTDDEGQAIGTRVHLYIPLS